MRRAARPAVFLAIVLFVAAFVARATNSLAFEGGGYWVDIEVGQSTAPTIASVRFHRPGDSNGVTLQPGTFCVEAFDTRRKVLVMHYTSPGGARSAEPFSLVVHESRAVLEVAGRRIVSRFDWSM